MQEFQVTGVLTVSLRLPGGVAEIVAEERASATVEVLPFDDNDHSREAAANTHVGLTDDTLFVHAPEMSGWLWHRAARLRIAIRVPQGARLRAKLASADLRATGRYGWAHINSASGDVSVDQVSGDLTVTTASGDLFASAVDGNAQIHSASGDAAIDAVTGEVNIRSASGDIQVGRAGASVHGTTASGDVVIRSASRGRIQLKTASGDVHIGVAAGTNVWLDLNTLSGDARSDLTVADTAQPSSGTSLQVQARTISGDITVHRVAAATSEEHPTAA